MRTTVPQRMAKRRARLDDAVLLTVLATMAMTLVVAYIAELVNPEALSAVRYLALVPVALAAYRPQGPRMAQLVALYFSTAYLSELLRWWGTPGLAAAVIELVVFILLLHLFAFVAANIASTLRQRDRMTMAVQDWESLLRRFSDLNELSQFMLESARSLGDAETAALLLRNPLDERWELTGLDGQGPAPLPGQGRSDSPSLAQWLVTRDSATILHDLGGDARFVNAANEGQRAIQSLLAQPLRERHGKLVGMVVLLNKREGWFTPEDLDALRALTAGGEHILAQAGLYAHTDQALAQRVDQLGAIQRTAQELNATLEARDIVGYALACALVVTGADGGLVSAFREGEAPLFACQGADIDDGQAGRLICYADAFPTVTLREAPGQEVPTLLPGPGAQLVASMRRAGRSLGAIIVESRSASGFGQEVLPVLATLADHVAIALDNARLFGEIQREQRKSEQIIETMADGLLTVDESGRVVTFNRAAETLTGWPATEARGRTICDVLGGCGSGGDCDQGCELWTALSAQRVMQADRWTIRQRLGSQRVVALSAAPLILSGSQGPGLVVLFRDVTDRDRMERFQEELIATFSHELRTPLATISSIADLLMATQDIDSSPRTLDHLRMLRAQSRRLAESTAKLLEVAQLDSGAWQLEPRPQPAHRAAAEAIERWQAVVPNRQLELQETGSSPWIWADERTVQHVLDILLENATKYSPAGSAITVQVAAGQKAQVVLSVVDQGPGIAPEHQARIFERFYRVDGGDARQVYGYGLGLHIARRLVEAMGGGIWVRSEVGQGSCFSFAVPELGKEHLEDTDHRG